KVVYDFNKYDYLNNKDSSSPAKIDNVEYKDDQIADNQIYQVIYFNQDTLIDFAGNNGNHYSMVGYTFLGYSTQKDWTNVSNWNVGSLYSDNTSLYDKTGFFASNVAQTNKQTTFVAYDDGTNYVYNFYNIIKDQIHNSMYDGITNSVVTLYSVWKANRYEITFDMNKNNGSTTPQFYNIENADDRAYNNDAYFINDGIVKVIVTYDTNVWNINYNGRLISLEDVLIDRYGYTWTGWYVNNESASVSQNKFFNINNDSMPWNDLNNTYRIIAQHSWDERGSMSLPVLNYEWILKTNYVEPSYDTTYSYLDAEQDRVDSLDRLNFNYPKDTTNGYDKNQLGSITLYAGWQANTYSLSYDYGTNGINTNSNSGFANVTNNLSTFNDRLSHDSTGISLKNLDDTTSPLEYNSGNYTDFVFDVEYDPQYITRIGYTFVGWRFGLNSEYRFGYKTTGASTSGTKFVINEETVSIDDVTGTAVTNDCYLYTDKSKIADSSEYLGTMEVLGDTTTANNIDNHYLMIFAIWEVNTYTVKLDVNSSIINSTKASCTYDGINASINNNDIISIELSVVFDTNVWFIKGYNDKYFTQIDLIKLGYSWIGWYSNVETVEGNGLTIDGKNYNDFIMSGTNYDDSNPYNVYVDKNANHIEQKMPKVDYSLFNQFIFRTYGETTTNANYVEFTNNLKTDVSNVYGYAFTSQDGYGNWIEDRKNNTFGMTIYAKWQGLIYEVSFNKTDYNITNNRQEYLGTGSTEAHYLDEVGGLYKEIFTEKIYVMFDTNLYTTNYKEIYNLVSDYNTYETEVGDHIEDLVRVDRYGYTWTGWYTHGYVYDSNSSRVNSNGSSTFKVGTQNTSAILVMDGINASGLARRADDYSELYYSTVVGFNDTRYFDVYSTVKYNFANNGNYTHSNDSNRKFDNAMYNNMETITTNERNKESYTMTLYAGWLANIYDVYYEANDCDSTNILKNYTVKKNNVNTSTGFGGSSPAFQIKGYTQTIEFDAKPVEATAFQRVGYTFIGYSLGQTKAQYFKTDASTEAKSTEVMLDYNAIAFENLSNLESQRYSGRYTDSYLCSSYDNTVKTTVTGDLYGRYTYEILGDDILDFAVVMQAFYRANIYQVSFDSNKIAGGSTTPYFYNVATGKYTDEVSPYKDILQVEFDTNNWVATSGNESIDLDLIKVDRYGYTWMGWFTKTIYNTILDGTDIYKINSKDSNYVENLNNYWKNYYKFIIMSGSAIQREDGETMELKVYNYEKFLANFNGDNITIYEGVDIAPEDNNDNS
ncbi:MAG: hypothetical protein IJX17_01510, partial [Clostridia bacterium]|nr:hypothetical protein [Clostridia bacterium]